MFTVFMECPLAFTSVHGNILTVEKPALAAVKYRSSRLPIMGMKPGPGG